MRHQGRFGDYINVSQQLTPLAAPNSKGEFRAFFNAVVASDQTSTTDSQLAGGSIYTGPFRSRPDDDIGVAVGITHANSRIASARMLQNALGLGPVVVQGAELFVELHYTLRPTNGLLFRPSVQYVINPGGTSQNTNALVLGFTTSMNF
jgi:porin